MKKLNLIIIFISLFLILSVYFVIAVKSEKDLTAITQNNQANVNIPENAIEVSPGVFDLGTKIDKSGKLVQGYAFIHYKNEKGEVKPSSKPSGSSSCYVFLSKGAKWKSIEQWVVNPANTEGLNEDFILNNLAGNIQKWEDAAGKNILGDGVITNNVLVADTVSPDGVNEIYFADIANSDAIAVTIVWGYFSGPIFAREIIEWDQVYDDVDFSWNNDGNSNDMDFENIVTHELGHSVGLGDLYSSSCSEQTMYGYATEGETKKRTLEQGDILGIRKLYS